jgi:hypothetical protein
MARANADMTVVVCANRSCRILQVELSRANIAGPGPKVPAKGFGEPSCSVRTDGEFADALMRACGIDSKQRQLYV